MPLSIEGTELVELLERVFTSADKCHDEGGAPPSEEDRAVEGLKRLKKWPVTTKLLMETQVGKRLRKLSKHSNKRISTSASEVLEIWKQIVANEATENSIQTQTPNTPKSNSSDSKLSNSKDNFPNPSSNPTARSLPLQKNLSFISRSESEKSTQSDPVIYSKSNDLETKVESNHTALSGGGSVLKYASIVKIGEVVRDKPRQIFAESLALVGTETSGSALSKAQRVNISKLAVDIEVEMWKRFGGKDLKDYKNKFRSISFNIKDPSNPDLRRRVLLGEVTPSQLMAMSSEDMASDKRKEETAATKKKLTDEAVRGQQDQASTDQFKCGKCKHRKTTYFQLQTRSADEPMTTFVTCVNCNNRWKFC